MKRNYRTAYNQLKKIGVPVYEGGYNGDNTFRISAEENYDTVWADYYKEFDVSLDDFGVNHRINDILIDNGLYAEWENGGVLGVAEQ
jgi:hypothetical protein|tara:strand:+ start:287 stop:547 length:261 start_codon:yes stop_codon:yes gene_type:complete